jgi:autotransporter-associated beta strand protein
MTKFQITKTRTAGTQGRTDIPVCPGNPPHAVNRDNTVNRTVNRDRQECLSYPAGAGGCLWERRVFTRRTAAPAAALWDFGLSPIGIFLGFGISLFGIFAGTGVPAPALRAASDVLITTDTTFLLRGDYLSMDGLNLVRVADGVTAAWHQGAVGIYDQPSGIFLRSGTLIMRPENETGRVVFEAMLGAGTGNVIRMAGATALEITNGLFRANATTTTRTAGVLYAPYRTNTLTLRDTVFEANWSNVGIGVIYAVGATLDMTGGGFYGNYALRGDTSGNGYAGVMRLTGAATITMTGVVFDVNRAGGRSAVFDDYGGAGSTLTFNNCVFTNNWAGYQGGAIMAGNDPNITLNYTATTTGAGSIGAGTGTPVGQAFGLSGQGEALSYTNATAAAATNANAAAGTTEYRITGNFAGGAQFTGSPVVVTNEQVINNTPAFTPEARAGGFFHGASTFTGTLTFAIADRVSLAIGDPDAASRAHDSIAGAADANIFQKTGGGDLILNADNACWRGTATIWEGRLLLGNGEARLGGTIRVQPGATFGGAGEITTYSTAGSSLTRSLAIWPDATLQVGLADRAETALVIRANTTLHLNNNSTVTYVAFGGTHAAKLNAAAYGTIGTGITVNLAGFQSGTYNLGNLKNAPAAGPFSYAVNGMTASGLGRQSISEIAGAAGAGAGDLVVYLSTDTARAMRWTGAAGTPEWDDRSINWTAESDPGSTTFAALDTARFDTFDAAAGGAGGDTAAADIAVTLPGRVAVSQLEINTAGTAAAGVGQAFGLSPNTATPAKTETLSETKNPAENTGDSGQVEDLSYAGTAATPAAPAAPAGDGGALTFSGAGGITATPWQEGLDAEAAVQTGGLGKLIKTGAGDLVFANTGGNTFSGGVEIRAGRVAIDRGDQLRTAGAGIAFAGAGTLRATGDGAVLPDNIAIAPGVSATFETDADLRLDGALSGGAIIKTGAAMLVLGGSNAHASLELREGALGLAHRRALGDGALVIAGADVAVGTAAPDVVIGTPLDFAAAPIRIFHHGAGAGAFAGAIRGTGDVRASSIATAAGAGTLVLAGENNFASLTVTAGAVAAAHPAALGGGAAAVVVQSGATLNLLAPETAAGDLLVQTGATLGFHNPVARMLAATGAVTIENGATLAILTRLTSGYSTLVHAGAGLEIDPYSVTIDPGPNNATFRVYTDAGGNLVLMNINRAGNPGKDIAASFDAMTASVASVHARMSETLLAPLADDAAGAGLRDNLFWLKTHAGAGKARGGDGSLNARTGYRDTTRGVTTGVDWLLAGNTVLAGVYGGWNWTHIKTDAGAGAAETDADIPHLGAYAAWRLGKFYAAADIFAAQVMAGTTRSDDAVSGDYKATIPGAGAEIGAIFKTWNQGAVRPFAGLRRARLNYYDHDERAGAAGAGAIYVEDFAVNRTEAALGAHLTHTFALAQNTPALLTLRASWHTALDNDRAALRVSFADLYNDKFEVPGDTWSRDRLTLGAGVRADLSRRSTFALDYDAEASSDRTRHTFSASLRIGW